MTYTDAAPIPSPTSNEKMVPQGPVPAPCPQGGHSPTRPSSSADLGETDSPTREALPRYTATYSPDDNKLRLYAISRLDRETYERVRAAGFLWAPRQELFVAPSWSPDREDLLLELAGEVGDEDTSLADRAAVRAERFETYSAKRERDAEGALNAAHAVGQRFEGGQPILIGHHSEKRARKDKARMDAAMQKAVNLWRTSEYWERRAAGALRHAKYKELPAVRARRIKKLEAERRGIVRTLEKAERTRKAWTGSIDTKRALMLADAPDLISVSRSYSLAEFPRPPEASQYKGAMTIWSALDSEIITTEQARDMVLAACDRVEARNRRWLEHYDNRITYERAMLGEMGGLPADRFDLQPGGQILRRGRWFPIAKVNRRNGQVVSVTVVGHFAATVTPDEITDYRPPAAGDAEKVKRALDRGPMCNYPGPGFAHMTAAEWKALPRWSDGRYTENHKATDSYGRHRTKCRPTRGFTIECVFITDAKRVDPPAPGALAAAPAAAPSVDPEALRAEAERRQRANEARAERAIKAAPFEAVAEQLKNGGAVAVSAPQLFPTPDAEADRMVELADLQPGDALLEPSAGTGQLLRAVGRTGIPLSSVVAVEVNQTLAAALTPRTGGVPLAGRVVCGDFLEQTPDRLGRFDVILMNPPFVKASDVAHIRAALAFLKPGGRLVAICADGPRQRTELRPLVQAHGGTWEALPAETFKAEGTAVRTVLLTMRRS